MKNIIIIGENEPGYELLDFINDINKIYKNKIYNFIGFYDEIKQGENIINNLKGLKDKKSKNIYFANSIGDPKNRMRITEALIKAGLEPTTLIHPKAYVADSVILEKGVIAYPGVSISHGVIIEKDVLINYNSSISHGCKIGKHSNITPGVNIAGNVNIGKCCFIGIGSAIIEKVKICDNTHIGANSLVINDIEEEGCYVGSPIKKLNKNK